MGARSEAQEERDRRRHARAEDERSGCALERADDRLGLAYGFIVGAAVGIAAAIKVVGIALEGRGEVDRRHDRTGAFVDRPQGLSGQRARAERRRFAHSARPRSSFGAPLPAPPASAISMSLSGRRAINDAKPEIAQRSAEEQDRWRRGG